MRKFEYAAIVELSNQLQAELLDGEKAILIDVGAIPRSVDCSVSNCTATVEAMVGKEVLRFTGTAWDFESAIRIARMKLRDARTAYEKRLEKEKAEKKEAA